MLIAGRGAGMKLSIFLAMVLGLLCLAGCVGDVPLQPDARSAQFKAQLSGPPEAARVYLLPTYSKGLFRDLNGRASFAIFSGGSDRGVRLGSTSKAYFLAFDVAPGRYDIQASGDDAFARMSKPFDFEAGKSYFLRPSFFRAAVEIPNGTLAVQRGITFDMLPASAAATELAGLDMAALTAEGQAFVKQTFGSTSAVHAPPLAVSAPPAASEQSVAPNNAEDRYSAAQRKLRELKGLHAEGLITQEDYDSRRKAILDAY